MFRVDRAEQAVSQNGLTQPSLNQQLKLVAFGSYIQPPQRLIKSNLQMFTMIILLVCLK